MTDAHPLPDEAVSLFGEAPEGFIAARDELVRRLRDDDRANDAAAVKAMRKPTVVTWTLNQLSARDPDGVAALLDAGSEVRAVQRAALSSTKGAADRLKEASADRRGAITALTATARSVLEDAGRASPQHIDAVRLALETASTDPDAGDRLRTGTFERPPEGASGFGDLAGLTLVPDLDQPTPKATKDRTTTRSRTTRPVDGDQERETERKRLRRDRDAAVREATKAREAAERYSQELEAMHRRMAVVDGKHRAAEADATEKEAEATRAKQALAALPDVSSER
ncbi:MAG TPA: hypothetical protein VI341_06485 [Actinomycetota bacterium]